MALNFLTYQSPFTWRYGSEAMRKLFSEQSKYRLWRKIWVALAKAQHQAGLVSQKELQDLEKKEENINIERILEIEKETKHDLVAAIREFAEKTKVGGGKIHLGATSMDIIDNAEIIRIKEALIIIEKELINLLRGFREKIKEYAETPCIGYTHLQPAEPTTVGYRLAFYAQDLLTDFDLLQFIKTQLRAKGIKGAVGTAASYTLLLKGKKISAAELEKRVMKSLDIKSSLITTQVYSRKYDFLVLAGLASIASSLAKFTGDLRLLQSANFGEWSEPFGEKQIGSSAMPFKKNPVSSEKVCSLSRYVSKLPEIALENASLSYLERTMDDSANKRVITAEAFLATEEVLLTSKKILAGLVVNKKRIHYNLEQFGIFAATEPILIESVKNGADRQKMHEILREIAIEASEEIQKGKVNPLKKLLIQNKEINKYVPAGKLEKLLQITYHIGSAPERALILVKEIEKKLK